MNDPGGESRWEGHDKTERMIRDIQVHHFVCSLIAMKARALTGHAEQQKARKRPTAYNGALKDSPRLLLRLTLNAD